MKSKLAIFSLSSVIFLSGCASTTIRTAPNPGDPIANFPRYCIGDKIVGFGWSNDVTNGDISTDIVEKVYDDGSYDIMSVATKTGKKTLTKKNNKWQTIAERDLTNQKDLPVGEPPPRKIDFPLFVGKQWKDSYKGMSVSGYTYSYQNTYTVTDYKEIEVDAGVFKAFRIFQEHSNESNPKKFDNVFYYAPEAKFIIKSIPSWRIGYEANKVDIKQCD